MKIPTHLCVRTGILLVTSLCVTSFVAADATSATSGSNTAIDTTFLRDHCIDCHGGDTAEGNLNLADLAFDPSEPSNRNRWVAIHDRVASGEMPPPDASQPKPKQADDFLAAVASPINKAIIEENQLLGRVRSRRLNRVEYENTMHDVLGVDIPLQDFLPEDTYQDGFATVAIAQQVSHHLLEKYLAAADASLEEAFRRANSGNKQRFSHHYTSEELGQKVGQRDPWHVGDETIAWSCGQVYHGRIPETEVKRSGWYRITLHDAHMVNTKPGEGVWCTVRTGVGYAKAPIMYPAGTFRADEIPREQSFTTWIRQGHLIEARPSDNTVRKVKSNNLNNYRGSTRDKRPIPTVPGLAYSSLTLEEIHNGPDNDEVARRLFGDIPIDETMPRKEAARLLQQFASRAFRRPVTIQELAPYMDLVEDDFNSGVSFQETLKRGYRTVLCSPRFLFLNEMPGKLDDFSIASRLSYFLWSSMPDDLLLAAAQAGELSIAESRRTHVNRMLDAPRASGMVTALANQWLNLRDIDFTSPDAGLYPEFDEPLQLSMVAETHAFLEKLIDEDLPTSNLIDSDFAMLNERLAKHYDIPDVHHESIQAVALTPDQHRGGVITQGAVLKVTANGTTTSPVVRGAFINERLLGVEIPPPPDNVPAIEPDIRGATSIRDQLSKHSTEMSCAACHIKIDPPGFALESYDVVGGWRTTYRNSKAATTNLPVDPHHEMATGEKFEDIEQFKQIILKNPEQIARNFTHQLMTYATGGSPSFSDRSVIEDILNDTKSKQFGVRTLIHAVVDSPVFLSK